MLFPRQWKPTLRQKVQSMLPIIVNRINPHTISPHHFGPKEIVGWVQHSETHHLKQA